MRTASRDEMAGDLVSAGANGASETSGMGRRGTRASDGLPATYAPNGALRGSAWTGDAGAAALQGHRARAGSEQAGFSRPVFDGDLDAEKSPLQRAAKRGLDILLSLAALLVTAPLMAVLAAIIRVDSKGPVLYRQIRIGRDGLPFELVKLRTMHDDGRVTSVGRFLRPTGLDELPQFWNVLLGHMSVVGPRPERPHLVAQYESTLPRYTDRHLVRPGITGWAQIHGQRGGVGSIAERLHFDLEYVRTWRVAHDLRILVLTAVAVWRDTRRELEL